MNRVQIRKLIIQELKRTIGEDAIITDPESKDPHIRGDFSAYDAANEELCEQCGGMTYEDQCMEAGCGGMSNRAKMLQEGDCGCGTADDGSDYSIDSMLARHPLGDYSSLKNTNITADQAFDAGYEVAEYDEDNEMHQRKHNNYMAKPALYKVAKYAEKLLHMIPDGYELDDWQRTKIAQISDDISEVYHSLDYDFRD